ncbi:MAG: FecR domain-containing protein [Gemmatimonadaceae bacterium]|nr:FecR domain-containing protein [Gemmatimonadaceae bacterium]
MNHEPDWTLLGRYFSADCSRDEADLITQWAAADEANARLLTFMRRVWEEAGALPSDGDEDEAWAALRERVAAARRSPVRGHPLGAASGMTIVRPRARPRALLAAAAAIVLIAGAGAVLGWQHWAVGTTVERSYATARGQRAEVMLVDGTRVWLSVDTHLRVPRGYGAHAREVELGGEAIFAVQHDAKRPFRVRTRGAVLEDLGTEFSVRAYPDDADAVVVVVASGKVSLRRVTSQGSATTDVELVGGQMGRLDRDGRVRVIEGADLGALLAWRAGELDFEERPFRDVLRELERWYDLDIAVDDSSILRVPVTTSLHEQTADQALAIIASTLDIQYSRDGRHVRLSSRPRAPHR